MKKVGMVLCNREGGGFKIPQRWFDLTEAGEDYLGSWADSLAEYGRETDLFLRFYEKRAG
jgi:hypothetical protein